jgi:hypothetical protein
MTFHVSTGLRNSMLDTESFKTSMDLGLLRIYKGTVPADADAALATAVILTELTVDAGATAGTWEAVAVSGIISKTVAETWQGLNSASGLATFFRFVQPADDGTADPTQLRIQGAVALVGGELNLSNTTLTIGGTQTVNNFNVALPTV